MDLRLLSGRAFAAAFALALAWSAAARADDYPSRPIRMEVGYAAGGPTDVVARIVAKHMSENLGTSVIVENKPGASASIAANDVMRSAPDGYKVLVTSLTLNVNPLLYPKRYDYDPVKAFEPITNFANNPMLLVTNYDSPYKDLKSLIADAKAHPGKLTFGSSGVGGSAHLAAEMLSTMAGIKMIHVPFKGNGPALQEMVAGRISFMFYPSVGIANYVAAKQLRVLAVGTDEPQKEFPGVPTLDSLGFKGFQQGAPWIGMLAPAGTPKPIVDKLNKAAVEALAKPEVREQLAQLGAVVVADSPEHFRQFLIEDKARWADVIKKGNVTVGDDGN
ncbi:Bug family tripartite tricarboxylate transporter substrate binding protein [Bordetella genomosp. 9]|uniref:ABC transporter substrate-binding protein n=1 Tax=Bordetella genomosp. 9 TaxID=1416803 RepID=A0A1W6YUM1_9BORD|nr:tripartite tricarboxylate transporter substrate binding protein [Bordetella genomosp. 9]ARP84792.1 ABC transporter substrate-binding protein [Bordetella genomosp. 9]ARP88885.1 ABC transporter substrate-binding protein [Bordetella genomosp. 9]